MATDSTTSGYLAPLPPDPKYDDELETLFHDLIAGITGIADELVRPRWQPRPPNMPDFADSWVAFGVTLMASDWNTYQSQDGSLLGATVMERGETINVLCSFYGPHYQAVERRFRDGIQIEQNRDALVPEKIKLIETAEPVTLPALLKEVWVKRIDTKCIFRRWVTRVYPVRDIVDISGIDLDNEHYITHINTSNP